MIIDEAANRPNREFVIKNAGNWLQEERRKEIFGLW